ncbi:hypothetical protein [Nonomuraea sp. B19D2]|uniref:hypothetical protein n=1 Tax=Nonomuraea sp. B19D2 TaxID=3159561 RepID=UPI0032DA2869
MSAFQLFHLMDDHMKVEYIPCNDGITMFHCWATPHGWAWQIVKLAEGGRKASLGIESRDGATKTWEQFLDRMRDWAADYDGTNSAPAATS